VNGKETVYLYFILSRWEESDEMSDTNSREGAASQTRIGGCTIE
jgi:hypothetical protein